MTPRELLKQKSKGLYAITAEQTGKTLVDAVKAVLIGGASVIQYRNKQANSMIRWRDAEALCRLCEEFGTLFIVNDDVELAAALGCSVHLGREDGEIATARTRLGQEILIGASCYNELSIAQAAIHAKADYVAFGSIFPSNVKPNAVNAPISLLNRAKQELKVPIVAIGGITPQNGKQVVDAGADFLAVISGLFMDSDPKNIEMRAKSYCMLF